MLSIFLITFFLTYTLFICFFLIFPGTRFSLFVSLFFFQVHFFHYLFSLIFFQVHFFHTFFHYFFSGYTFSHFFFTIFFRVHFFHTFFSHFFSLFFFRVHFFHTFFSLFFSRYTFQKRTPHFETYPYEIYLNTFQVNQTIFLGEPAQQQRF